MEGRPGLFGNRPPSGAGRDEGGNPRGLASVVAMLQSQRGSGAGAAAAALTGGRSRLSQQHGPFAGVGLAAAAAGHGGEAGKQHGGSVHSHAISPSPTSYQPASPQTREAASPARCAARARLAGFPLMSGASLTPSITSGEEDEVSIGAWALGSGSGVNPAQTIAQLRNALAAAEGAARVAAWSRDAAERRAAAAEAAAAAAGAGSSSGASTPATGPGSAQSSAPSSPSKGSDATGSAAGGATEPSAAAHRTAPGDEVAPAAAADPAAGQQHADAALADARRRIAELESQLALTSAELEDRQAGGNEGQEEAPDVAELQAQLLGQSAAVDAAERRAELAERQKAESQRLLVALQATLMQSAIANSAAGTPLHSPHGMSRTPRSQSPIGVPRSGSRSHVASASSDLWGSVSSPPTRLSACNSATDLASKPGGGSSEAAEVSPTAAWLPSRSCVVDQAAAAAALQQDDDAAAILALHEELEATRAERDAAREVAKRAAGADAPGLAELWRQLLESEAAARAAAAAAARVAFVAGTPGAASEGCAAASTPPRPLGELWARLGEVSAEREALKRSASQAEQQLSTLQRARSASAGNCDLSRAFAAAAAATPPATPPPAKRARRASFRLTPASSAGNAADVASPGSEAYTTPGTWSSASAARRSPTNDTEPPAPQALPAAAAKTAVTVANELASDAQLQPAQPLPAATDAAKAAGAVPASLLASIAAATGAAADPTARHGVLRGSSAAVEGLSEPLRALARALAALPTLVRLLLLRALTASRAGAAAGGSDSGIANGARNVGGSASPGSSDCGRCSVAAPDDSAHGNGVEAAALGGDVSRPAGAIQPDDDAGVAAAAGGAKALAQAKAATADGGSEAGDASVVGFSSTVGGSWAVLKPLGSLLAPETALQQASLAGVSLTALGAVAAWWFTSSRRRRRLPRIFG